MNPLRSGPHTTDASIGSSVQSGAQPSPRVLLPSSHSSPVSTRPLPQRGAEVLGLAQNTVNSCLSLQPRPSSTVNDSVCVPGLVQVYCVLPLLGLEKVPELALQLIAIGSPSGSLPCALSAIGSPTEVRISE